MTGAESAQPLPEARRELFKRIRGAHHVPTPQWTVPAASAVQKAA